MKTKPCPTCHGSGQVTDDVALGAELRQLRTSAGLSLRALADKVGISFPYLADLEKGRRHWHAKIEQQVRSALS